MSELNIDVSCANTAPAKGRVERAHQTLQDRLVKELRLAGVSTIDEGNAFLPTFTEDYNRRFGQAPIRRMMPTALSRTARPSTTSSACRPSAKSAAT